MCIADFYFPHLGGFRWAVFVEYHPFAKWGCPFVPDGREDISQIPVICQPAPPSSPRVTRAAVSPHSPTQPPTTWRDSLWGHPMSSQMYESVSDREQMFGSLWCDWEKSGDPVWGSNAGQAGSKELRPHDTSRSGVQDIMGNFWIPLRTREWPAGLRLWVSCYMVFSVVHMGCFMLCQMTTGDRPDLKIHFVSLFVPFLCSSWPFFFFFAWICMLAGRSN